MEISHHWIGVKPNPNNYFGFVYVIIDHYNKMYYIGKKQYHRHRTKKVKGRKNRVRYIEDSDWPNYTGSNNKLNAMIDKLGKEYFTFKILKNYKTKSGLHYGEVEAQIINRALVKDNYYNGQVSATKFKPKEYTRYIKNLKIKEEI